MINKMNLKDRISADKQKLNDAELELRKATRKYDSVRYPIEAKHKRILDTFMNAINSKIKEEHTCDCCSPKLYDEAFFKPHGILLLISANHPHDICEDDWTWEQVEDILKNSKE